MLGKQKTYTIPEIPGAILWKPTAKPERVSFEGTSFWPVKEALLTTFGDFPFELTSDHLALIKAMEAAAGEGKKPYSQLAEAIEKHGSILITMATS